MIDPGRDDSLDSQIRAFLDWEVARKTAPSVMEMATRVGDGVGARPAGLRLAPMPVWIALVGLLIAALLGAALVGASLVRLSVDGPTSTLRPSATPFASLAPNVPIVVSGTTASAIGQLSWTTVEGDASGVPAGVVFEIPSGYGAFDVELDGATTSRFWMSADGVRWATAPVPVPAQGRLGHGSTSGTHWIWSTEDLRLWRSPDFAAWAQVSLDGVKPPVVPGVKWVTWPASPVALGRTTLLPWYRGGQLAMEDLLGFRLEPGESWELAWSGPPLPLGTARDVFRTRHPQTSDRSGPDPARVRVGSIRVGLEGSVVTITDADRDIVLTRIDAIALGFDAADLAMGLNGEGGLPEVREGAVISDRTVQRFDPPADLVDLFSAQGRFVGIAEDPARRPGSLLIWVSTNGRDWESLGPAALPSAPTDAVHFSNVLRIGGETGETLMAPVLIDAADGGQRQELWSSTDGFTWAMVGEVYRWDGSAAGPRDLFRTLTGGFIATGAGGLLVSPDGADWTAVDGFTGIGNNNGGEMYWLSATRQGVFKVSVETTTGRRGLWFLQVEAGRS